MREERAEKTRSTMTLTDLARRKDAHQGPEFRTRLEFIRFLADVERNGQSSSGPSGVPQAMELDDEDEDDEDEDDEEDEDNEDEDDDVDSS